MQFELDQNEAVGLINILAKLPNETMTFPIAVKIKAQFDAQLPKQEVVE